MLKEFWQAHKKFTRAWAQALYRTALAPRTRAAVPHHSLVAATNSIHLSFGSLSRWPEYVLAHWFFKTTHLPTPVMHQYAESWAYAEDFLYPASLLSLGRGVSGMQVPHFSHIRLPSLLRGASARLAATALNCTSIALKAAHLQHRMRCSHVIINGSSSAIEGYHKADCGVYSTQSSKLKGESGLSIQPSNYMRKASKAA